MAFKVEKFMPNCDFRQMQSIAGHLKILAELHADGLRYVLQMLHQCIIWSHQKHSAAAGIVCICQWIAVAYNKASLARCRVWTNAASALALAAGLNTTGFCYQFPLYPGSSKTPKPSASLSGAECANPNQYAFWDAV